MPSCRRIEDPENVRIERRLGEDRVAEPLAAGDPSRPLVVAARIAHEHREERRPAHLPHVHEPHDERRRENHNRIRGEAILLSRQRRYASPGMKRATKTRRHEKMFWLRAFVLSWLTTAASAVGQTARVGADPRAGPPT